MATKKRVDSVDKGKQHPNNESRVRHPSLRNVLMARKSVKKSPFLQNEKSTKGKKGKKAKKSHHEQFRNYYLFIVKSRGEMCFMFMCFSQDSVYVLDEANLAAQGIDFWENQKQHSRVNTLWWADQLKQRKQLKRTLSSSKSSLFRQKSPSFSPFNAALSYQHMSPQKIPNIGNADHIEITSSVIIHSDSRGFDSRDFSRDSDQLDEVIEDTVIRHHSNIAVPPINELPPLSDETPPISPITPAPSDLNQMDSNQTDSNQTDELHYEDTIDEFESLLHDYKAASKQLLDSEIEKQQTMIQLNQQQEVIEEQNKKIQELERQFAIFENTLKETDSLKQTENATIEDAADVLGKFEKELAAHSESVMSADMSIIRVGVTQQITKKVRDNMSRQFAENGDIINELAAHSDNVMSADMSVIRIGYNGANADNKDDVDTAENDDNAENGDNAESESLYELKRRLVEKQNEIHRLRGQLQDKEILEMELRQQLVDTNSTWTSAVHSSNWALYIWIVMMFWAAHRGT